MKKYVRLYNSFLKQYLKSLMEYKTDFFIGLFGFLLIQGSGVIFLGLVFSSIPSLKGWSFYEILFIYGFAQIPRGIDHIFTDNLWIFGWKHIVQGEFDRYLLRPLNPLFQLLAERFQPDGFGEIIVGISLLIISSINLDLSFSFFTPIIFIFAVLGGTLIYTSIKLITSSLAFWFKNSMAFISMSYNLSDFAKYPVSIYPKTLKGIVTYIFPFAFTGFYPAAYFLGKETLFMGVILTCIMSVIFILIGYKVWLIGLRKYESAGN